MTFKVGDKVRCIGTKYDHDTTIGNIYEVRETCNDASLFPIEIIDDNGVNQWVKKENFELVQEDKLHQSQTKKLSKPIRSCEWNGSIYKKDTIDGVSIEDMKATRDNINSKLQTHRNLFNNTKK